MKIGLETVVKEVIYIAILLTTIRTGQWLTSSEPQWGTMLIVAFVYLLIRVFVVKPKSPVQ